MPVSTLRRMQLTDSIRQKALELGFSDCGFSKAEKVDADAGFMEKWLEKGNHGTMDWLERNREKRYDPRLLLESTKTLVSVAYNYFPQKKLKEESRYLLSKYAYGKDYHDVMKEKLRLLLQFIEEKTGNRKARVFVDSAPVLERYWAQKSGLGFIGKNSCLINRKTGSFFFIGHLLIDLELQYNEQVSTNFCGSCTLCIDACPTVALQPFDLDARKCLSYITIEYRGKEIPKAFIGKTENRIFGCDICQDVCPWNRNAEPHQEPLFDPSEKLVSLKKEDWETMDKPVFKQLFKNTAVERAGWKQLKRNITFCLSQLFQNQSPSNGL